MKKNNKKELHQIFIELKNKSQTAYNKLYEKYYSLIYGVVFSILKNKDDAEDVTHEVFTKIYKLEPDKLPNDCEASWLYTVSKNECFLHLRKIKPNIRIDEIYEIPSESNDIDNIIDSEYYNKLMSGLKEDEKMIVSLKVLSNFTFKKISQIMEIPIGTVQWKYYNAINSLRISIGSLAGAVVAFIIVIARGEFLKSNEFSDSRKNERDKTKSENNIKENESVSDAQSAKQKKENQSQFETNSTKEDNNNVVDIPQEIQDENTIEIIENKAFENVKLDKIQIGFVGLGIICLIIFLIFFKIYQQKLKIKSSK